MNGIQSMKVMVDRTVQHGNEQWFMEAGCGATCDTGIDQQDVSSKSMRQQDRIRGSYTSNL